MEKCVINDRGTAWRCADYIHKERDSDRAWDVIQDEATRESSKSGLLNFVVIIKNGTIYKNTLQ
jgi:hypothetical protein